MGHHSSNSLSVPINSSQSHFNAGIGVSNSTQTSSASGLAESVPLYDDPVSAMHTIDGQGWNAALK
ncbi:hypothetical protein SARC_15492, partial [Sphaeroforma arctica JP610]